MKINPIERNLFHNFFKFRDRHPFSDRTGIIAHLNNKCIDTPLKFQAITRPSRFGKTYTVRMLQLYYSNEYDAREVFDKLNISQDPSYLEHLNKYHAIVKDISVFDCHFRCLEGRSNFYKDMDLVDYIEYSIIDELKENPVFNEIITNLKANGALSLRDIIIALHDKTSAKFIALMDEWDFIFRVYPQDFKLHHKYMKFIQGLFNDNVCRECFSLVYMSGILPIKLCVPNELLNNFYNSTIIEPLEYDKFFGLTDEEVQEIVVKYHSEVSYEELKKWYRGYKINDLVMYNPYSIAEAIFFSSCKIYAGAITTNGILRRYMNPKSRIIYT